MIRIITLCSSGIGKVDQQAQWSGYSEQDVYLQVLQDLQIFLSSLNQKIKQGNGTYTDHSEAGKMVKVVGDKKKREEIIKRQIDNLLDELNKSD